MIVLKATQDKVLAALQSVASIVERRHTLPILANVLIRKMGGIVQLVHGAEFDFEKTGPAIAQITRKMRSQRGRSVEARGLKGVAVNLPRSTGFFSSVKANLRNAP